MLPAQGGASFAIDALHFVQNYNLNSYLQYQETIGNKISLQVKNLFKIVASCCQLWADGAQKPEFTGRK